MTMRPTYKKVGDSYMPVIDHGDTKEVLPGPPLANRITATKYAEFEIHDRRTSQDRKKSTSHTHTPGPWNVNPDYGKENMYRLWDEDSNYHDDTSPERMDANARLIASAPELLEALKAFATWETTTMNDDELRDIFAACHSAIAKAEGK